MRGQPTLQHDCPCAYSSIYIFHSQPKVLSFSIYCVYQLPVCYLLVTVNILFVFVVSHINSEYKKTPKTLCFRGLSFFLDIRLNYRFENCGARRAALRPYFLRSFIRGSLVKNPAALSVGLYSAST